LPIRQPARTFSIDIRRTPSGYPQETDGSFDSPILQESTSMLKTRWPLRLRRFAQNRRKNERRRIAHRRQMHSSVAAEVLEGRQLLTVSVGIPYLAFAVQPSNALAGHPVKFTVDVMINERTEKGIVSEVDTAVNGTCTVTSIGPGIFYTSYTYGGPQGPNYPSQDLVLSIINGVGMVHPDLDAFDVAGKYQLEASDSTISSSVISNAFTISPFTATDHLVFLTAPSTAYVGVPTTVRIAVVDQFGNVDTSVSSGSATLLAIPGNESTAPFQGGYAVFDDVVFVAEGPGVLLALGDKLIATDSVEVFQSGPQS
jgi:hypothetical protein